jgi:hypothetical protein
VTIKDFPGGRIRKAEYDDASQELQLHFDNGNVLVYKHVPAEVFRRLCSAPNPATYWEDRIAEEYPKGPSRRSGASGAPKDLRDLFGGADDGDGKDEDKN